MERMNGRVLGVNVFELRGGEFLRSPCRTSAEQGETRPRSSESGQRWYCTGYTHDCMFTNCLISSTNRYRAHFSCPRAASCRRLSATRRQSRNIDTHFRRAESRWQHRRRNTTGKSFVHVGRADSKHRTSGVARGSDSGHSVTETMISARGFAGRNGRTRRNRKLN